MINTRFHFEDGQMVTERVQDCTPIAEHAKALHNEGFQGSNEFRHAAKIPLVFVEAYCNQNNIQFSEFMGNKEHIRRLVNDPALAHFRIWKGRL